MKITLLALLLLAATADAQPFVGVVCTDYSTGKFSVCEPDAPWSSDIDVATIHADAVARAHGGLVYVVNRLGADNVQVLDPADGFATVLEFSVGTASNPQGIAFSPDGGRAYIPRQERDDVLIVDPTDGSQLGTIDLSGWNDADGHCEPGDILAVDDLLFVAIARLDRDFYWTPVGDSYLAVIDTDTDALVDVDPAQDGVQGIALTASNPAWELGRAGDLLHVSCVGNYGLQDGGVELVDPATLASLGLVITEAALGGDVGDVVWFDADTAYAIVSDAAFNTHFVHFDPATSGDVWVVAPGSGYAYTDAELDHDGELFLTDRSAGGLAVFDAATGSPYAQSIPTGLPPYDLVIPAPTSSAPPAPPLAATLRAWPNPFNPTVTLRVDLPAAGPLVLRVYDAAGRAVATLFAGERAAGAANFAWRPTGLAAGVYLARAETAAGAVGTRLVLLK